MDKNSNSYTLIYASVMVILVAGLLSFAAISLKPLQTKNIEIEAKQNILASVNIVASSDDAERIYSEKIINTYVVNSKGDKVEGDAFSINMKKENSKPVEERRMAIFEFDSGEGIKYILPLYGAGLWGPLWGYISVNDDMNTIFGANFDHAGETPGLGAEISTKKFQDQFTGKKIFDTQDDLVSIMVAKSNETAPEEHRVDGISGGTITSKGLQNMIMNNLSVYKAFLQQHKSGKK